MVTETIVFFRKIAVILLVLNLRQEIFFALKFKFFFLKKYARKNYFFFLSFEIKKKEILESDAKLNEYLESNPDAKKQYEFNKKMIDFRNIQKLFIFST